jgi:hypothetical protein
MPSFIRPTKNSIPPSYSVENVKKASETPTPYDEKIKEIKEKLSTLNNEIIEKRKEGLDVSMLEMEVKELNQQLMFYINAKYGQSRSNELQEAMEQGNATNKIILKEVYDAQRQKQIEYPKPIINTVTANTVPANNIPEGQNSMVRVTVPMKTEEEMVRNGNNVIKTD